MKTYVLSIDQSTQGTKGLLFDEDGTLVARADRSHRQIVDARGWVEHDPKEILSNTLIVAREAVEKAGIDKRQVRALGISNQRETALAWDRQTGEPVYHAIVWQCARGAALCARIAQEAEHVRAATGLPLSPYFSAAKLGWILETQPLARSLAAQGRLCCGTVDSFLVYALTREHACKTDYSNASRTQLFNLHTLAWDESLCDAFGVPRNALAQVCMSDSVFGTTDLGGWLDHPIPVCGVLGDSHGALFGQDCRTPGMTKATYGTGSSVMTQVGEQPVVSGSGLVSSVAWGMHGKVQYVLEGNINYTGAVISWLKNEVGLLADDAEAETLARAARADDTTYCVPAFSGLGAPYWDSDARATLSGMSRTTGRAEIVKACLECIGYQISDLITCLRQDTGRPLTTLRVDGGPTANGYLMQFQSDIAGVTVQKPAVQELSGMGAAYMAGISAGIYDEATLFASVQRQDYCPQMPEHTRAVRLAGWQHAVRHALTHT